MKQDKDGYNRTRFNSEITGMLLPEAIDNEFTKWLNKVSNYASPAGLLANNIEYCDEPSNYESVYHNSSSGGEIIMGRHNNLNIDKGTEYMFTPYEIKEQDEK